MSFRTLVFLVLLTVLVPSFTVPVYYSFKRNLNSQLTEKNKARDRMADAIMETLDGYLNDTMLTVHADAKIPQLYKYLADTSWEDALAINELLRTVILKDPVFVTSAGIIDVYGINIQDTNVSFIGRSEQHLRSFATYKDKRVASVSADFRPNQENGLTIASPIQDLNSNILGYLRIFIEPAKIQALLNKQISNDERYLATVITEAGDLVAQVNRLRTTEGVNSDDYRSQVQLSTLPWTIRIDESAQTFIDLRQSSLQQLYRQLLLLIVAIAATSFLVSWFVTQPIRRLSSMIGELKQSDRSARIDYQGIKEFSYLSATINDMADRIDNAFSELEREHTAVVETQDRLKELNDSLEQRVADRTGELRQKNEELQSAMERLVQNEKMAALGNLVAGISHELNTPIGISLTASTDLQDEVTKLSKSLSSGTLSRSAFQEFVDYAGSALELLVRNNFRAIELIRSFKEVSIDQSSDRIRAFNLADMLHKLELTIRPVYRRQNHELILNIDESISMYSYPGALEQIITNLITNSVHHGFENRQQGRMTLNASEHNGVVKLVYSDNGCGIASTIHRKVFNPFFTTKLGQGGSGMGLYILFNLVTNALGGTIDLQSSEGNGVIFTIQIPANIDPPNTETDE